MYKIHRCKPNTTYTGLICWKLYNDDERNQEDLKTGETYDFHEWKTQQSKVSSPQVDKQLNVIPIKLQQDSSRYKQDYF